MVLGWKVWLWRWLLGLLAFGIFYLLILASYHRSCGGSGLQCPRGFCLRIEEAEIERRWEEGFELGVFLAGLGYCERAELYPLYISFKSMSSLQDPASITSLAFIGTLLPSSFRWILICAGMSTGSHSGAEVAVSTLLPVRSSYPGWMNLCPKHLAQGSRGCDPSICRDDELLVLPKASCFALTKGMPGSLSLKGWYRRAPDCQEQHRSQYRPAVSSLPATWSPIRAVFCCMGIFAGAQHNVWTLFSLCNEILLFCFDCLTAANACGCGCGMP